MWKERRILITGASSGLGLELAGELVARGARVAGVARGRERLAAAARERGFTPIAADVSSKDEVYRISSTALEALGGLDLLVNAASTLGPSPLRPLLDTDCEDLSRALETNLLGPFRLTKAVLPALLLGRGGTVVNISSDAAVSAYPRWGAYSTSKAALDRLGAVWGEELRAHGVRFLAFDPGDMDTPLHREAVPDADPATLRRPRDSALALIDALERERDGRVS
jgi:NAD(P)-dependent dehydrogenase (short-subunit alcohol dehydrogenase family)